MQPVVRELLGLDSITIGPGLLIDTLRELLGLDSITIGPGLRGER
jgi:hypothetical protein